MSSLGRPTLKKKFESNLRLMFGLVYSVIAQVIPVVFEQQTGSTTEIADLLNSAEQLICWLTYFVQTLLPIEPSLLAFGKLNLFC